MGDRRENDSDEPRQSKTAEISGAAAEALLAADEVAAEIAIRSAMDAGLGTAEMGGRRDRYGEAIGGVGHTRT